MNRKLAISFTFALLIGLPFLAGWVCFRSFDAFAHNDDFLYARCTEILVEEGRYQHVSQHGKLAASVASHCVWGALICWPFGFSYDALLVSVGIAAWIGAASIFYSARELGASQRAAFLSALSLVVGPYYYGMSFTYMTDVTATAFASVAILGYAKGISRKSLLWLVMGALAASAATWARQTHLCVIVFPLVACTGIALKQNGLKRAAAELMIAVGIPVLSFVIFELGLLVPGNADRVGIVDIDQHDLNWVKQTVLFAYGGGLLLGLATLPMLPMLLQGTFADLKNRCRWFLIPACTVLLVWGGIFAASRGRAYLTQATGYIVYNAHLGPILLGDQNDPERWSDMGDVRWSPIIWQMLTVGAIFTMTLIAGRVGQALAFLRQPEERSSQDTPNLIQRWARAGLIACLASSVIGLLAYVEMVYDRYWMLCYPMLFTLVATCVDQAPAKEESHRDVPVKKSAPFAAASMMLTAVMFALSFVFVHDFLAWNHTRYAQVKQWTSEGLEPKDFDAGNGINGWFRAHEDVSTPLREGDTEHFWRGLATEALAIGPRDGWTVKKKLTWYSWAVQRDCDLYVISKDTGN